MRFELSGADALSAKLSDLSRVRFEAVVLKNMAQIYNRGKADGGTPVDTGELRLSLGQSGDEVGYTKDYAPHVEYGHRTANGGFVKGQRFLERNVEKQRPVYKKDLVKALKEE